MPIDPEKSTPKGRQLLLALVALACAGFVLLSYVLWTARGDTWREAELTAGNHAELLEVRLDAALRRLDADLAGIVARLPLAALETDRYGDFLGPVEQDLERHQKSFPEVAGFRVIDAKGDVLFLSSGREYINLADREYFTTLRDRPESGPVFSQVIVSRITGRPVMVMARALRAPDGQFMGIVSAPLDIGYFEQVFKSISLGKSGALFIRRTDNHALILREPAMPDQLNRAPSAENPIVERLREGKSSGVLRFVSQSDGIERIYAYRALHNYPFYVVVGLSNADVDAAWQNSFLPIGGLATTLFAALAMVLVWLFRTQAAEYRSAAKVREQREKLKEAQYLAKMGSWELDLVNNRLTWSDAMFRIFEIDEATQGASYEYFLAQVHPDDRALVDIAYRDSVARHEPYEIEHRLLMPDGRVKFIHECGETFYSPDGTPLRSVGTAQDISSIRQLESQMQLLGSAFKYSGEAIVITDSANNIITVNPAFCKLTGYTQEEAVGKNPRFLSAGRNTRQDYEAMWQSIIEKGYWQGEIWDRRKDGAVYPKWISISVIRDESGKIVYHIAHFTDISAERAAEAQLQYIAHHDSLTGLANRLSLTGRLDQALAAARRDGSRVALLFIDLDRFKVINDTLGHHVGDMLLIEVAKRLSESVRDSDVVARLGGDEFVVMLTGIAHSTVAASVAEKIVEAIGYRCTVADHDLYTTPSIGIALFPSDGQDADTLMKNADAAMYHAKSEGRNNFQFFDARMNSAALERLKIEHALRQALVRDEFCLHYQPVIDLATGRVAGVEALVRWNHPELGVLLPGRFIGIAEETGLIQPLGEWVFWSACRQLAEFRAAGIAEVKMAINISAVQMRNSNLPTLARGVLEAFAFQPEDLIFEITESVAMNQPEETVRILDVLHSMGIVLAIDDFGTGYSSLSYLRMFPIDYLKLDRSFVAEIGETEQPAIICDATIGLARNLGLRLVAEGIETEAQLDYLQSRGCGLGQGYYFSRPVPSGEVIDFIRQRNG